MWQVKKNHDFCPRDIEPCHQAAARRVKLWSLNANLFSNYNILGLAAIVAFIADDARFTQI